jgi:SprT-like family
VAYFICAIYCIVRYKMVNDNISAEFYVCLDKIGGYFNLRLFDLRLPPTIFTLNGDIKALGHFRHENWTSKDGGAASEIILNPDLFAFRSWIELLITIAHQQCHLMRCIERDKSRPNYHNKRWSKLMEGIGLIPTSTGKPGGSKTGQNISEYLDPNGKFLQCCVELMGENIIFPLTGVRAESKQTLPEITIPESIEKSIRNRLLSRVGVLKDDSKKEGQDKSKLKIKYSCPSCKNSAWGKPSLRILCANCDGQPYIT